MVCISKCNSARFVIIERMNTLNADQFAELLKAAPLKPRFKRDIKFLASVQDIVWDELELLPVWNKSKNGGVLLLQPDEDVYMIPFDATKSKVDSSGKVKPVICDLCYTYRTSGQGGFVTFYPNKSSDNSLSLLCCQDLLCSDHVRTKTSAALNSRAQLREHMTNEDRVERLRRKLREFIKRTGISPVVL